MVRPTFAGRPQQRHDVPRQAPTKVVKAPMQALSREERAARMKAAREMANQLSRPKSATRPCTEAVGFNFLRTSGKTSNAGVPTTAAIPTTRYGNLLQHNEPGPSNTNTRHHFAAGQIFVPKSATKIPVPVKHPPTDDGFRAMPSSLALIRGQQQTPAMGRRATAAPLGTRLTSTNNAFSGRPTAFGVKATMPVASANRPSIAFGRTLHPSVPIAKPAAGRPSIGPVTRRQSLAIGADGRNALVNGAGVDHALPFSGRPSLRPKRQQPTSTLLPLGINIFDQNASVEDRRKALDFLKSETEVMMSAKKLASERKAGTAAVDANKDRAPIETSTPLHSRMTTSKIQLELRSSVAATRTTRKRLCFADIPEQRESNGADDVKENDEQLLQRDGKVTETGGEHIQSRTEDDFETDFKPLQQTPHDAAGTPNTDNEEDECAREEQRGRRSRHKNTASGKNTPSSPVADAFTSKTTVLRRSTRIKTPVRRLMFDEA